MVSELATAKGLITRFCNKLEQFLARFKDQQLDSVQVIIEDHSRNVKLGNLCHLEGAFLHARYGNPEELIQKLIDKLDHYKIRSETLKDQLTLFEQVQVTVLQLKQKGEHVDSQVMVKKVLSKFPAHIQRRVLAKRRTLPSTTSSTMETLFNIIEDVLSEEEMMNLYVKEPMSTSQTTSAKEFRKQESLCMYYKGVHKSSHCDTYKTSRERTKYLRDRRLCQLCASQHKTYECKRKNCFRCGGPHHSSCCFKTTSTSNNTQEVKEQVVQAVRTDNKVKKQVKKTQKVNVAAEKEQVEEGE
ncbi:hypothetical protein COOONC_00195 [Cooperia oncophora]